MEDNIPDLAVRLHRPDSILCIVVMSLLVLGYFTMLSLCLYFRFATRRRLAIRPRRDLMMEKGEGEVEIDARPPR